MKIVEPGSTSESRGLSWLMVMAASAALLRLLPLGWLHPLNYDEIEFFRATDWVRQGLVPYRDFWEHHTPLQWIVFAPLTAFARGSGVSAVVTMRWMQIPLWIAIFLLVLAWMRSLGVGRLGRWTGVALALASSFLMIPAVEYRIDTLACALYLAGLLLVFQTEVRFGRIAIAGAAFALAVLANIRIAPLVVITMVLVSLVDAKQKVWRVRKRALALFAGALVVGALALGLFAVAGALEPVYQQVWVENYLADRLTEEVPRVFLHRLLSTIGLLMRGTQLTFEPTAIDPGGAGLLILGGVGVFSALRNVRKPDSWFIVAVAQLAGLIFIARMKRVYNYHFELVGLMMVPFVGAQVERLRRKQVVVALAVAAWCVTAFTCVFRGKELDRKYQDLIMREVDARTQPGEKVWDGVGFALRRQPAYRFWFLPDLAVTLVAHGLAPRYGLAELASDPPAAVVADYNVLNWLGHDRVLRRYVVSHYLPVWRNLWVPAPNARLSAQQPTMTWVVARTGEYRLYASRELAVHPWFRAPFRVSLLDRPDAAQFPLALSRPVETPGLRWMLDGRVVRMVNGRIHLRKGQRLGAILDGTEPLGVMLVPGEDLRIFRQPPAGVTLEAAYPRRTHVPRVGVRLD